MALRLFVLAACIGLSGCATVYSVAVSPDRNDVYGGVRLDSRILGAAATNGDVDCGLADCSEPRVWLLASGALCDLPLSLIGDTLLLPYTAIRAAVGSPG